MELLLSTPLNEKDIIRGQHLALGRQFGGPLALLIGLEIFCVLFEIVSRPRERSLLFSAALVLAVDFFTLRWVAMWVGINARSVNRAILKTAMLVLALPWFLYNLSNHILPALWADRPHPLLNSMTTLGTWWVVALLTDLVLFLWAKPKLLSQFRFLATLPIRAR